MFDFIRNHQMNIMLALCSVCVMMAVLLLITRFLPKRRKWILVSMEIIATLLLAFDRFAYIYSGNTSPAGYVMVRLSNFMVFFLTSGIVFWFNLYLADLLSSVGVADRPKRLHVVGLLSTIGMLLAVATVFTGLYYSFDAQNRYHRGPGFLICYIVPVLCPVIQFTVIQKFRKRFSRFIYTALVLYIFVPIAMGIVQIFTYGISIVNMAMVLVSVSLYIFTYLDINDEVERVHKLELETFKEEQKTMKHLFANASDAFVAAVEKRDELLQGHSRRIADIARRIALKDGKTEEESDKAYYAALLHNVGFVSLPDGLLEKEDLSADEEKLLKALPERSGEILSSIGLYPYLSEAARFCRERFDGKGYPQGLKGDEIPELARIVAVADAYDSLTSRQKSRKPLPKAVVRETFIKEAGYSFDPRFADIMVRLMDSETNENPNEEDEPVETEICSPRYREKVSVGIPVQGTVVRIRFKGSPSDGSGNFSAPSIILFDSFDRHVHESEKAIESYRYLEYGELWFDGHYIVTSARNMEAQVTERESAACISRYEITAGRYDDHLFILMESEAKSVKVIVALPSSSKSSYIGLTGENFLLSDIQVEQTEIKVGENDIPRIAGQVSFINRIEADVPNIQINSNRSATTEGIKIKDMMTLSFSARSFPEADFVWHCPYIVLFYAEDGRVGGKGYREYALVKFDGEDNGSNDFAENHFVMKKTAAFHGWHEWKEKNKAGLECAVSFEKKGNSVTFTTENLGISIENRTTVRDGPEEIYAALTGDQCALTDIQVR